MKLEALLVSSLVLFFGCAKDKNADDFRRDQLQQSLSRINSISGTYSGPVISKVDGSNLGFISLNFQARTDVESRSGQVSSEQNAIVSGSLSFKSLTSSAVVFDNGFYDDVTGDFQVSIPILIEGATASKLILIGQISNQQWNGTIEVNGQPDYGAQLNLIKNATPSNTQAIEVGGTRLQQIRRLYLPYQGSYKVGGEMTPFTMLLTSKDTLPEQNFYKLFSPIRTVNINCDFQGFELNFFNAVLDDKAGTLTGSNPLDQRGDPARATLNCLKYEASADNFGWDCEIQTRATLLRMHLKAKI